MAVREEYIDLLISIPGFSVGLVGTVDDEEGEKELLIQLKRKRKRYKCLCGKTFTTYYDCHERCIRDLRYGPYKKSSLVFWQVRVECPKCGIVTESLDWVDPRVSYTKRLAITVALSCQEIRSLKAIASEYGLHWSTVKEIHKTYLEDELPKTSETSPTMIAVDEFAIKKNHKYGTVVADFESKTVPYVGEDRKSETLASYYKALGKSKCQNIKAVAMDMWKPYIKATKEYCPNASIVFDPFHIISAYGREVIDKVRSQETNKAEDEKKKIIKGSRYLLLKNRSNLKATNGEPARLSEILKLNANINIVYTLKDDLRQIWNHRQLGAVKTWFKSWYKRSIESEIPALVRFAEKMKRNASGIYSYCKFPIHTGFVEGINNKIKVIKRIAFGYRDLNYFFLRIRGAFHRPLTHTEA